MSAATQNYMDELIRELDLTRRDYEVMNKLREGAEQERDELREDNASLKRCNGEWNKLLDEIFAYVDQNELARLGQSRVKALIDAHEYASSQLNSALAREAALWETLIKIADMLGIDANKARTEDGKPSDIYAKHLTRHTLLTQAEALEKLGSEWGWERPIGHKDLRHKAKELRQRAQALD